ncbi:MAG TPA: hypothetical protein IAC02_07445 [Candidatus Coprovivens excrementavium]|nr:hypothetical protein [Candidatus Coprovivens excrementavium]
MNKKEKLTFSKIEILFMIVMVALVIVTGITIFTLTTQKRNVENFKNDSEYLISFAKNAYASIKMNGDSEYIVTGSDGSTKGMCITIKGLKDNDFLQNEYSDWEGYIVIEESASKKYNYSIWATNKKYVLNGYDSSMIKDLSVNEGLTEFNDDEFSSKVKTSFTGTSGEKGGTGNTDGSSLLRYEAPCINEKIE